MTGGWSAAELRAWDSAHTWHPFTPHGAYADDDPLMIVAGEGHELIDVEGRRYLDGVGSLWCNLFGHRRAELDAAVAAQLGRIAHATFLGNATAPAVALAKRLVELAPAGLTRVFYSDNGSTAVEVALKMALQYWQQADGGRGRRRTRFLTFANAYHGDTVGAVSLGGIPLFHARYGPLLFDTLQAPSPYAYRCEREGCGARCAGACLAELERLVAEHGDTLAAIVLEPGVQGAAGMLVQPPGFVRRVRKLADQAGTLLILDEVAVGFGRSGTLFASEHEGVSPDLLCLAKGLTGGYLPLAATLATERIFAAFLGEPAAGRTFFHGHTYTANPLAAAAAHATLDIFERTPLLAELPSRIARLAVLLEGLRDLPAVGDIRQYGLAAGIELVRDRRTKAAYPVAERRGMRACRAARAHGVFLRPLGDVLVLMPPLTLSDAELERLVTAVRRSVEETCSDAAS
ncbi:MAG TPA: adenosylmethionine--8-amino-7-oxononanoate transaminase [Gemmatimonadales bacterium]|nr:adenosylmethionine--8-amino-7-oxononanoate transaminase [Gemmatimonadales bacterium]